MDAETDRTPAALQFRRRLRAIAVLIPVLFLVLAGRLAWLQLDRGAHYARLARHEILWAQRKRYRSRPRPSLAQQRIAYRLRLALGRQPIAPPLPVRLATTHATPAWRPGRPDLPFLPFIPVLLSDATAATCRRRPHCPA